jgi:hypothetical protein
MRHITACSLVFSVAFGFACVPSIPGVGKRPAGAGPPLDAGLGPDPAADEPPSPTSPADQGPPASRPDGAIAGPVDAADAMRGRAEAGSDDGRGPPDAAEAPPRARAPRAGDLFIDELLVDPPGDDLGHEWLEVANLADEAVDLSALHVSDDATDVAVDAGVIAAGALLVLGQSTDRAHNGDAPVDRAYGTRLALNNGADRIAICLGACAGGATLDAVAWTTAWGAGYVGHAVVVVPGTRATCPAEEPYGTDGNFGSPGRANPACPSPPATSSDGGARDAGHDAAVEGGAATDATTPDGD